VTLAASTDGASSLTAARDIKLTASQVIVLGEASAGRDLIARPGLLANRLSAGRTCIVGASQCSSGASLASSLIQNSPALSTSTAPDAAKGGDSAKAGAAASERNGPPPLLTPAPAEADVALTEPVVTGAGSEEIWRKHQRQPAKPQLADAKR